MPAAALGFVPSWLSYGLSVGFRYRCMVVVDVNVKPVLHYKSTADFRHSFKGVLGRRTRMQFAPPLWREIIGERTTPLILTFAYYEDAFEDANLSFSVEGTFAGVENETPISAYRVHDYETFAHFVGLANQVYPFEVLPGTLSLDACQVVRRGTHSFDLSTALASTYFGGLLVRSLPIS